MELQVCKCGNRLAVRLPLALVEEFGIVEDSHLRVEMLGARLPGMLPKVPSQNRKALAVKLRAIQANRMVTRAVTKEEMSRY